MATATSDPAALATQLELVAVHLRTLSHLPEAQREGEMKNAVGDLKGRMDKMEATVKKYGSELQSLRDTTENRMKTLETQAHNSEIRAANHDITSIDEDLLGLLSVKTNEPISGLPKTARQYMKLSAASVVVFGSALDWDIINGSLREKRIFLLRCVGFIGKIPQHL